MNIEKIKIRDNCYVWVDKYVEKTDIVYHLSKGCIYEIHSYSESNGSKSFIPKDKFGLSMNDEMLITDVVKIIAASPELELEGIPDYVEWLAEQWIDANEHKWSNNTNEIGDNYGSFIKGYKTAEQEMFTEDDMKRAILQARIRDKENPPHPKYSIESIIEQIKLKNNEEF